MSELSYRWKPGAIVRADANVVGAELERLTAQHGGVTPRLLVEEARREDSPLHDAFDTWDVHLAAERHWEERARYILRNIVVEIPGREDLAFARTITVGPLEPKEPTYSRAFFPVYLPARSNVGVPGRETCQWYVPTARALSDADLRKQVLERACKEMKEFVRKYGELEELAKVFETITKVMAELQPEPMAEVVAER